mmetsp:Transcript_19748/g.28736  ORF Transcript_19748/g.28736 Transcript_19748/m.28736 type:complete len:98 (-) Transcript_19748:1214-1507(-)|eukprot:CAMPEP_0184752974 /NCGR_PEP_ID=MMETSP0315-20130426/43859_1 /TAXON_ID=101924 /ORGANISM="Rhodosorus marinus, Strain UTEX LB 2760" /LENGTH=97 /DNA_ID=CAMNT_0027232331 /DNA_START=29 /DNA_END=322 /DNA_ORIENTATION=-
MNRLTSGVTVTPDPDLSMRENLKKFSPTRMELELLGEAINDTQETYRLIKGLPRDYATFAENQRNQKEVRTRAEVTEKLLSSGARGSALLPVWSQNI